MVTQYSTKYLQPVQLYKLFRCLENLATKSMTFGLSMICTQERLTCMTKGEPPDHDTGGAP